MFSITELCQGLVKIGKSKKYYFIDRLIYIILTFPLSTTITKRAFLVIKIVKIRLCNKKEDDFFANCLILYIEREIVESFNLYLILDDFVLLRDYKVQL